MTSKLRTLTTAAALALLIAPTGASAAPVCPPRTQPTAVTGGDYWFAVCPGRRVTIRAIDRPCGRAGADRLVFRNSRGSPLCASAGRAWRAIRVRLRRQRLPIHREHVPAKRQHH